MNTCSYDGGSKHSNCSHPNYCIFNENRWELMKKITHIEQELNFWKLQLNNLRNGGYHTTVTYSEVKKKIKSLELDLKNLRLFEFKVINGDIDGYGFVES